MFWYFSSFCLGVQLYNTTWLPAEDKFWALASDDLLNYGITQYHLILYSTYNTVSG